jgi:hypothetical protein
MKTMFAKNADAVVGISENDQVFAQQARAHRLAVALGHLFRHANRQPVPARKLAHGGSAFDPAEKLVLLLG